MFFRRCCCCCCSSTQATNVYTNSHLNTTRKIRESCVRGTSIYIYAGTEYEFTVTADNKCKMNTHTHTHKHSDAFRIFGEAGCGRGFPTPIAIERQNTFPVGSAASAVVTAPDFSCLHKTHKHTDTDSHTHTHRHRAHVRHDVYTRLDIYSNSNPHTSSLGGRLRLCRGRALYASFFTIPVTPPPPPLPALAS